MGQIVRLERVGRFFSLGSVLLVRALRRLGWSQNELARRLGTDSGVVSRWLHGQKRPSYRFAAQLAELLEIPLDAWLKAPPKNFTLKRTGTDG